MFSTGIMAHSLKPFSTLNKKHMLKLCSFFPVNPSPLPTTKEDILVTFVYKKSFAALAKSAIGKEQVWGLSKV